MRAGGSPSCTHAPTFSTHRLELQRCFEAFLASDHRFELVPGAPPRLGLVCFRIRHPCSEAQQAAVLERVNAAGRTFLVHTSLGGSHTLRLAIGGTLTQAPHVELAFAELQSAADSVLAAAQQQAPALLSPPQA